ncbi:hypothetical protein SPRG_09618 [Saprolegnia parasitica CBS 223.65]|uniref:WD repeat and coiled-coil-containing protein n=1 Tax=Saprolegnia parasitica (strain CBS 223.65) TaxID=695850 RepID=A0A067CDZ6_SAPPC|nr:hypothetical protein SPRG_09618 [Saprolegnia parasitica CBS 223.65]KDO24756.1 hypothetical protein SPRG_09618 [Saprolegnia parasitica CBS 223.65]|eukprot:XP_012204434.1 hypothetical protein SPRG_09618 [Saprolegnia parasitica CBS 223.65]
MSWPDLDLPPTGHRNLLGDGYDASRHCIALPLPPSSQVCLYPIAASDDGLTLGHGTLLHDASASSEPFRCMAWSTSKDAYVAIATQRHVEVYDAQGAPTRCLHWVAPARVLHITWHPSRPLLAVHMLGSVQFLTPLMALDGDGVALPWAIAAKQSSCWNEAGTSLAIAAGTSARVYSWPSSATIGPYARPQEDVLCDMDDATCGAITAIGCLGSDTFLLATEVKTCLRPTTTTTPAASFTIRARPMVDPLTSVVDTGVVDLMHITKSDAPSSLLLLPELHSADGLAEKANAHSAMVAQAHCVVWKNASSSTMSSVPIPAFAIPTFMHCHRRHAVLGSHASAAIVLLRVVGDGALELVETMLPAADDDGRVLRGLRLGDDAIDVLDTLKPTRLFFTPTLKTCSIRSRRLPLTSSLRVPPSAAVADGAGLALLLERLQSHLDARLDRIEASMATLGGRLTQIEARLAAS